MLRREVDFVEGSLKSELAGMSPSSVQFRRGTADDRAHDGRDRASASQRLRTVWRTSFNLPAPQPCASSFSLAHSQRWQPLCHLVLTAIQCLTRLRDSRSEIRVVGFRAPLATGCPRLQPSGHDGDGCAGPSPGHRRRYAMHVDPGFQCQGPAATSGILCSVTEDLRSARQKRLQIDPIGRQIREEHCVFRLEPEVDKGQNGTRCNG